MNTEFKRTLTAEYLARMERGELEPAEQGTASALIGDYIRMLENGWKALVPDDTPRVSER